MGFFTSQFLDVIELDEFKEDQIFYKWTNKEIKKGSKLILKPGQDAIFLYNGKVEGVFTDDGDYDVESQIIPFLSTLKSFKFGFNTSLRAEVFFINTKEFIVKWGTKNPINIPQEGMPGGLPIRANGTYSFKVNDYMCLIEKVAGVKNSFTVEDIKERMSSTLDQLLMKWITKEGKDMFNLQANAFDISQGIREDLDMQLMKLGITITDFNIMSFNYPKDIQDRITQQASVSMVGDVDKLTKVNMADNIGKGTGASSGMAQTMMEMQMGMMMGQQIINQMNPSQNQSQAPASTTPGAKFCPECGNPTNGSKFCPNCGTKLI